MVKEKIDNAVFIHIPKTAGITVEYTLDFLRYRYPHRVKERFNNEGFVSFGHIPYRRLRNRGTISDEFHNNSFKFCFCRNPYDRAVSHFYWTKRRHKDILPPETEFLEWTKTLAKYGRTFQPQCKWIKGVPINFIGRFERLEKDIQILADILDIKDINISIHNATPHPPYWEHYDEESKLNIEKYYASDFETFGYEHDNNLLHR